MLTTSASSTIYGDYGTYGSALASWATNNVKAVYPNWITQGSGATYSLTVEYDNDWGVTNSTSKYNTKKLYKYTAVPFIKANSCTTWGDWYDETCWREPLPSVSEQVRQIIRDRQFPAIHTGRKPLGPALDVREVCARQTILRVLGQQEYREYLKDGFISVRAKSGLVYQIYPQHGITRVYRNGELIERLCVVLKGNFPPTDSLIMRYLLILNDENDFRKQAIKHSIVTTKPMQAVDHRSLVEIHRSLKLLRKAA